MNISLYLFAIDKISGWQIFASTLSKTLLSHFNFFVKKKKTTLINIVYAWQHTTVQ